MQRHKYYFLGGTYLLKAISINLALEYLHQKIKEESVEDLDNAHDLHDHLEQRRNFYIDVAHVSANLANCRIKDVDTVDDSEEESMINQLTSTLSKSFNAKAEVNEATAGELDED